MRKKFLIVSFAIVLATLVSLSNFLGVWAENQSEIEKAVSYLKNQSQDAWTTMALAAAGEENINLDHLKSLSQKSAGGYAKYILALAAVGKDPTTFGDEDYVKKLKSFYSTTTQQFGDASLLNDDIWAILALGSIGQENLKIVQDSKNYILNHQNSDGGWSYTVSLSSSDTNDTAAAIMALLEAGLSSTSTQIQNAISFLKSQQNSDGGFSYLANDPSDSCSDAWIISAIYKLGQDPTSSNWTKNGKSALDHLKSLQDEDGGFCWKEKGDNNKFCSSYALIALSEKFYPLETIYNKHHLRIEGQNNTLCEAEVYGGTAMDLVISGSKICHYTYSITEHPSLGLYLAKINNENSWIYTVNNLPSKDISKGGADYYLKEGDEVLWFAGQWLSEGWYATKIDLTKDGNKAEIQVKYFDNNNWQDLNIEGIKVKIGSAEFETDNLGKVEISLNGFENGLYPVFSETQIVNGKGYIRGEKTNLAIGQVPQEHQVELKVEIEKIEASEKGKQEAISFSVSPGILEFGKLKPGETSSKDLTITNGGNRIYLEAEVSGASVFQENLKIDENLWEFFSTIIEENQSKNLKATLNIPSDYSGQFGSQTGELTFWAIKK